MLGQRAYVVSWDCHARQWEVRSATGFVLLESSSRREASLLCARLNRRFPRRHRAATPVPAAVAVSQRRLSASLWSGVVAACG
jgi:hypothetical protein